MRWCTLVQVVQHRISCPTVPTYSKHRSAISGISALRRHPTASAPVERTSNPAVARSNRAGRATKKAVPQGGFFRGASLGRDEPAVRTELEGVHEVTIAGKPLPKMETYSRIRFCRDPPGRRPFTVPNLGLVNSAKRALIRPDDRRFV